VPNFGSSALHFTMQTFILVVFNINDNMWKI
jgi:hypothetical protein